MTAIHQLECARRVMGEDTRASLLIQVRDPRDQDAWRTFFDIYAPLIMRWCRKDGLRETDAEDVTQNVLKSVASAMRHLEYQPDKGMFRSWLLTAVRREIARFFKKDQRLGSRISAEPTALLNSIPADELPASGRAQELVAYVYQTALERVRPSVDQRQWAAFELLWDQQQSAQVVGERLGESVGWVHKAKFNVIQRLKSEVLFIAEDIPVF